MWLYLYGIKQILILFNCCFRIHNFYLLKNLTRASLKTSIETVCGDNVRFGIATSQGSQYTALKSLTQKGVKIVQFPREILKSLKYSWYEVIKDTSNKNTEFANTWRSLSDFRQDYAVLKELSHY